MFLVDAVISGSRAASLSDERSAETPCGLIRVEERPVELRQIRVFEKIVCKKTPAILLNLRSQQFPLSSYYENYR